MQSLLYFSMNWNETLFIFTKFKVFFDYEFWNFFASMHVMRNKSSKSHFMGLPYSKSWLAYVRKIRNGVTDIAGFQII